MRLGQGVYRAGMDPATATAEAEADKSALDRAVADFMRKIKAFYDNLTGLKMQADFVRQHPQLKGEYDALIRRGDIIDASIKKAKAAIQAAQSAWDWFKSVVGLGGLEALPAVPIAIAAAAGAVTLITKWLADVYVFSRKIEEVKALEAAGKITPQRMTEILEKGTGPGLMDMLQRNIIWIVLGGALLMFGPEIMKMIRARR